MFNTGKKAMIYLIVFMLLFQIMLFNPRTAKASTSVLAGLDRYQTAVAISQKGWKESDYVVLVRGDEFADALCAGPLAAKYNAPILFTGQYSVNAYTLDEIRRLKAKHIIIVGGYAAIYGTIEQNLYDIGIQSSNMERIYGQNRYETSVEIAKRLGSKEIAITIGDQYADALSISAIAAAKGMSILLTTKDSLPDVVKAHLRNYKIERSYIIGGTGVISKTVETQVPKPIRLAGNDRYETNRVILEQFDKDLDYNKIYLASGEEGGYADSLAGVVLAAKSSSPIILSGQTLPQSTKEFMKKKLTAASYFIALGGEGAVPYSVRAEVQRELDFVMKSVFNQKGIYGPSTGTTTISGSLAIETPGILVQNTVVEGDLLLGEGIGYGEVELRNVTVKGRTTVRGGGENGITGYNFTGKTMVIDLPLDKTAAFRLLGKSKVDHVRVESSIQLDDAENTGDGFMEVNVVKGQEIRLEGNYNTVHVNANGVVLRTDEATIKTLNAKVKSYIYGSGTITTANISSNGVEMSYSPSTTIIDKGYTAYVGGQILSEGTTKYTPPPPVKITPAPISNLTATAGDAQVQLNFSAPSGASSVVLKQSINNGTTWSNVTEVSLSASSSTCTVSGLVNGTTYLFKLTVTGGNKAGDSNPVTATPSSPISNLNGTAGDGLATLTFDQPTGANSVVLRQSNDGGSTWANAVTEETLNANSVTATVLGLTNGQNYRFKLVVTGGGRAGESNILPLNLPEIEI